MVTITLTPEQVASVIAQNGTVVVTPSGPTAPVTPPPPAPVIPGFDKTINMTIPWGDYNRRYTKDAGGFTEHDCLVIKFTVPANAPVGALVNISGAEWIDGGTPRVGCLSLIPGDFTGTSLGRGTISEGTSFGVTFVVGPPKPFVSVFKPGSPGVMPGQTAYFNVKQQFPGEHGAPCNVFFSMK